jgi:NADH-quinone oxidoreductase subunit M
MTVPWLTLLWVVPAVGAIGAACVPRSARWIGVVAMAVSAAIAVRVWCGFAGSGSGARVFAEQHDWIPAFGAGYRLGVDGAALPLIMLTCGLAPVLLAAAWREMGDLPPGQLPSGISGEVGRQRRAAAYVALTLATQSLVLLSFLATDVLLFYLVFEAMLIPLFFLLSSYGGTASDPALRRAAAVKFLLYNLLGGLVMLAGVVGLYVASSRTPGLGGGTFDLAALTAHAQVLAGGRVARDLMFGAMMVAFAIKAPLWPLHTWLPPAATQTNPPTAVLMMAVVDKVGTYGMLRLAVALFPDSAHRYAPLIGTLAVIGVVYGAVLAIAQSDVITLIAYTSISHFGFIVLGIFAFTRGAQTGAVLYMVAHGLATAALFLAAGFLVARRGSREIADFGGLFARAPRLGAAFLIGGLATLSLPGLAPFVSELMVVVGTWPRWPVAATVSVLALVLSALYVLWAYQRIFTGPLPGSLDTFEDVRGRELAVLVVLLVVVLALGLFPQPVLDVIDSAGSTIAVLGGAR